MFGPDPNWFMSLVMLYIPFSVVVRWIMTAQTDVTSSKREEAVDFLTGITNSRTGPATSSCRPWQEYSSSSRPQGRAKRAVSVRDVRRPHVVDGFRHPSRHRDVLAAAVPGMTRTRSG